MAASMNATARMLGVSHRVHISSAEAEPARTPQKAATPPQKHAKRALRYMSDAEIAAYVSEVADTIQFEGSVMPGVEALVYGHCVKIVLSLVHEALDALPAFGILGLRLDVAPQKRRGLDLVEALRRRRGEDDAHGFVAASLSAGPPRHRRDWRLRTPPRTVRVVLAAPSPQRLDQIKPTPLLRRDIQAQTEHTERGQRVERLVH